MKRLLWILLGSMATLLAQADDFSVLSFTKDGTLVVTNAFTNGVVTLEKSSTPGGSWVPERNIFSVCSVTQFNLALSGGAGFFRPLAVDLTGQEGFTNLTESYGLLTTIADGTFYVLDRGNGLIRKVDTNGIMTLMVDNGGPIFGGRGLWVSPDESILFYASGQSIFNGQIMSWDSTNGLQVFSPNFSGLGQIVVDPNGFLVAADRLGNKVYRVGPDGTKTVIAGNGGIGGGGDGFLATQTGLYQVRAIWFLPTGAYFLGTDIGQQVWYVDTDGYIHLFLNGGNNAHAGDGAWFYSDPETTKVGPVRAITMDHLGNLLIGESASSYIRKISFQRLQP